MLRNLGLYICDVNLNQIEIIVIKILNIYSFNKPQNSILC